MIRMVHSYSSCAHEYSQMHVPFMLCVFLSSSLRIQMIVVKLTQLNEYLHHLMHAIHSSPGFHLYEFQSTQHSGSDFDVRGVGADEQVCDLVPLV